MNLSTFITISGTINNKITYIRKCKIAGFLLTPSMMFPAISNIMIPASVKGK